MNFPFHIFLNIADIDGPVCDLVRVRGHLDSEQYIEILENNICPLTQRLEEFSFMQDNSGIHGANIVGEFLTQQPFETIPFPAYSPDLNLIEHIWAYIVKEWPLMVDRSDAALNNLVMRKWRQLHGKPGFKNFICSKKLLTKICN